MTHGFGIPTAEYEERRRAFDLCDWINQKLRDLRHSGSFEDVYFERRGQNVKRLIEEAIPVSRLGLFLSRPGCDVTVQCFADNRSYDAEIEIAGCHGRMFKVEVTTSETRASAMRRQALARNDAVTLTGRIHRVGRTILDEGEMVDVNEEEERLVAGLLERLRDKVVSDRYDGQTAVLVVASEFRPISLRARAHLAYAARQELRARPTPVHDVYFCFWPDYSVVQVRR